MLNDQNLEEGEAIIASLLDQMLDAAIIGDYPEVKRLAKKIHKRAERDKIKIN